jgi:hypothetical protein
MATDTIANFIGVWYVKWVAGSQSEGEAPYIAPGYTMYIGTGTHGDTPAQLTDTYETVVGFSLLDGDGTVVIPNEEEHQPSSFVFVNGTLRWNGFWLLQPVRIYISLGETVSPSGVRTYSIYASTTYGDPDQVGVWGADGNPPHGG